MKSQPLRACRRHTPYLCFQTACRGGLYIRPRLNILLCNPFVANTKPTQSRLYLPIAQSQQRADM
ncbi:hypothetical protein [Neisseria montereyensis]|uniref:Uncharacterized protein n=1 Tax=Neisseria montereyensis TaxID=2973938 RepID=A0ABT2F9V2_9NEIS|nr:hypothetical protein [Neisseria montereyensis]MCS4532922.1 hypothetical protein [Neisseria montereyensis]